MSSRRVLLPDPKSISDRFNLANIADVFWVIGSLLALCLLLFSILTFTAILQHLFCVKADQNKTSHIDPKVIKQCSILCCMFGLICSMAGFSTFPICTTVECGYNTLGNAYFIINLISYISSKLCLYILFIHRLFNKYSAEIYQYSKCTKRSLEIAIIILAIAIILTSIFAIIIDHYNNNDKVDGLDWSVIIAVVIYVLADFILSGFTLVLFFAPLWNMAKLKKRNMNKQKLVAIIWKYGAISLTQTIISIFYGVSLIVRFVMGWYHTADTIGVSYLDMCVVIQLLDILITMLCIYVGFVRKETHESYCKICKDCCCTHFESCGCFRSCMMNPNKPKGYTVLWDQDLVNKPVNDKGLNVIFVKEYDDDDGGSGSNGCAKLKVTDTGLTDTLQSTLPGVGYNS